MKKWYKNLNHFYKVCLISSLALVLIFILLIPLFFFDLKEIPLGVLLGGGISILFYFLQGLFEKKDLLKNSVKWAIILNIGRLLIFGSLLFLVAYLYYSLHLKIFNIFAVAFSYFIPLIAMCVLFTKGERKYGSKNVL